MDVNGAEFDESSLINHGENQDHGSDSETSKLQESNSDSSEWEDISSDDEEQESEFVKVIEKLSTREDISSVLHKDDLITKTPTTIIDDYERLIGLVHSSIHPHPPVIPSISSSSDQNEILETLQTHEQGSL